MPIRSNRDERRISVSVGDSTVVLVLRGYTSSEYTTYMDSLFKMKGRKIQDKSFQKRVGFIDKILVGLEACDADGNPDHVEYKDTSSGEWKPLTPEVENWKQHVDVSWKIAAALKLEGDVGEEETEAIKN